MNKQVLILLLLFYSQLSVGQTFEGWVTYKIEHIQPRSIDDFAWRKMLTAKYGEKGYGIQRNYYKKRFYKEEMEEGTTKRFQVLNPDNCLLYAWKENATVAKIQDATATSSLVLEQIAPSDGGMTILGIPCETAVVKMRGAEYKLWFNMGHLPMTSDNYEEIKHNNMEQVFSAIKCIPLRLEIPGRLVQTAIEIKETPLSDEVFAIPAFKQVAKRRKQ